MNFCSFSSNYLYDASWHGAAQSAGQQKTTCNLQVVLKHGTEAMNFVDMLPGRWSNFIRGTDKPK